MKQQTVPSKDVLTHPAMHMVMVTLTNGDEIPVRMYAKNTKIKMKTVIDAYCHPAWSKRGAEKAKISKQDAFFAKFASRK